MFVNTASCSETMLFLGLRSIQAVCDATENQASQRLIHRANIGK